jgi:hypothetical protein
MALSNWDTIAWDENGKPTNGAFVSPQGVVVTIYKNWIHVSELKKAHDEAGSMIVNSGSLRYKDVEFYAFRGPQQGVYAIVWTGHGSKEQPYRVMFCAGVYGYEQRERLSGNDADDREPKFEGVRDDSLFSFHMRIQEAARDNEIPAAFGNIFPDKPLRFNQGDAYFAHHLGHETPATGPGEAQPTTMSEVVKAWSAGEKTRKARAKTKRGK